MAITRSSGLVAKAAFFFTGTSLVPVTRPSRVALAHPTTRVRCARSSLDLVLNTRPPISGSILSPVPSSCTRYRASASPIRPVWVSLRPSPSQAMNERIWPVSSAFSAATPKSSTFCPPSDSMAASQARGDASRRRHARCAAASAGAGAATKPSSSRTMRSAHPLVTVSSVARHHPAGAARRGPVTPGWPQWLAVTAFVISGALVTLSLSYPNDHGKRLLLAWLVSIPVVALRRWPLPVLAVVTVANALVMEDGNAPLPLGIILGLAAYLAASRLPRRVSITAAAISAAALGGALIYADLSAPRAQIAVEAVQGFLPLAAGWFIGDSAAARRRYQAGLAEQARP